MESEPTPTPIPEETILIEPTPTPTPTPTPAAEEDPILVIEPQGHSSMIWDAVFTPDGQTLITVSTDKTIRLWDPVTGDLRRTLRGQIGEGHEGKLFAAALSPDGTMLAVGGFGIPGGDKPIHLYNLASGEQIGLLKGHTNVILALAFAPDGTRLASGSADETVRIWEISCATERCETVTTAPLTVLEGHADAVYGVAFGPDGNTLVSGAFDDLAILWDVRSGEILKRLDRHTDDVNAVAFAPDGRSIVTGGFDDKIFLWDGNGEFVKEIDEVDEDVFTISFSADSDKLVVSGFLGKITAVYAIPSGEKLTTFSEHDNTVLASAFYGNSLIATAGGDDNDIYLWEADSGEVKTHIVGKGRRVWAVAFGAGDPQQHGVSVAFGNTSDYTNDSNFGHLERSFNFSDMSLSPNPPDESRFTRAQPEFQGNTLNKTDNYELRITEDISIHNDRGTDGWIRAYTFTPDGSVIVGSSYSLKLYAPDGTLRHTFIGHTGEVWAVSVSPDGRILASGSDDQTIKLWNIETGECLATLFAASDNEWVCWTPQGYYAASAGGEKYIGWHVNQGMDKGALFYPVSVFREQYLNPELVKRTIDLGSFEAALEQLNRDVRPARQITARDSPTLPPSVEWLTPLEPTVETAEPSVRVRAKITSATPITAAKLLLNGKPQGALTPSGRASDLYWEVEAEVPLGEDRNELVIFASNDLAEAPSVERVVLYAAPDSALWKPNLYMVAIGIADYANADLRLNYPDDDARAMSAMFRAQQDKLFKAVEVHELYDQEATRGNILDALDWLQAQTTQHDVAVIFVAAHGYTEEGNYYLLPVDGDPQRLRRTAVDWRDFVDILGNLPARVIFFLDSCHSGQLGSNVYALARGGSDNTEAIRELASEEYGVVIFAASTGKEQSLEHPDWGHGAFTRAVLDGLEHGRADLSGDGIVHLRELDHYISDRVKELTSGQQHPTTVRPSTISRFPLVQIP